MADTDARQRFIGASPEIRTTPSALVGTNRRQYIKPPTKPRAWLRLPSARSLVKSPRFAWIRHGRASCRTSGLSVPYNNRPINDPTSTCVGDQETPRHVIITRPGAPRQAFPHVALDGSVAHDSLREQVADRT